MRFLQVSWKDSALGFAIALLLVLVPIPLLHITDKALYLWLPGTTVVGLLGGPGLHDSHGVAALGLGIALDFVAYGLAATIVAGHLRRQPRERS